ncbi:hypothetical protein [Saccharopolyspora dendranthemae]|uniref:4-amino-4-deoxy-L-arabinose transferase-like glycosyltransferase n=1 Tax=Saccharopolyspora dendranthemae TaxID=1181886 RepID=A0A561V974_9PSEU|nr:hypothetical protein [Saccharopolyspora dendranthemae]TWG08157.1 hypothetical protein FHU35_11776 [Saccharopolyspora dendranthemae]
MSVTNDLVEHELSEPTRRGEVPAPRRRSDRIALWAVPLLAAVAGLGFVLVNVHYNGGFYIPPLDDTYIHLQYAKQIGQGQFLQYNDGDPISTGASSLLYVLVLGALHFVGLHGSALLPAAVLLGVVCHALTAGGVVLLGRRVAGPVAGAWAGGLVALSGPLLWGATSGMEVSATALLLVATLVLLVREAPSGVFRFTPVLVALAALCRMEALVFLVLVPALMMSVSARRGRDLGTRIAGTAWCALPFAVVGAQLVFYLIATGHSSPNGSQAKSHLSMPNLSLGELAGKTADNFSAFMEILAGLNRQDFAFPGALLLAALGVAVLVRDGGTRSWVGWVIGIGTVLALGAISTMGTALWQQVRYLQPFLPLFVLAAVIGLVEVGKRLRLGEKTPVVLLAVAGLFTALSVPTWVHNTVQDSGGIRERVVALAAWTKGNLPEGARLGVHDVGAAAYLGGHPTVDLVGLTTNGLAEPALHGMGALYEELRAMSPDDRPDYIAIYDRMPSGVQLEHLADAGVLGAPVLSLPVMTVYKADWSLIDTGDVPIRPISGVIRDHVNVGSRDSEADHDHVVSTARAGFQPLTEARTLEVGGREVVDSARHVIGEEEFTLHGLVPGREVRLIARHDSTGPKPGLYTGARDVRVFADGADLGKHWLKPETKGWSETVIRIPAEHVTGTELTVRMAAMTSFGPSPDYKSFGYWAVQ